jgi:hypothetical protein
MVNEMKITKSIPRKLESILSALIGLFFLNSGIDAFISSEYGFALAGILLFIPFILIAISLIVENPKEVSK